MISLILAMVCSSFPVVTLETVLPNSPTTPYVAMEIGSDLVIPINENAYSLHWTVDGQFRMVDGNGDPDDGYFLDNSGRCREANGRFAKSRYCENEHNTIRWETVNSSILYGDSVVAMGLGISTRHFTPHFELRSYVGEYFFIKGLLTYNKGATFGIGLRF